MINYQRKKEISFIEDKTQFFHVEFSDKLVKWTEWHLNYPGLKTMTRLSVPLPTQSIEMIWLQDLQLCSNGDLLGDYQFNSREKIAIILILMLFKVDYW